MIRFHSYYYLGRISFSVKAIKGIVSVFDTHWVPRNSGLEPNLAPQVNIVNNFEYFIAVYWFGKAELADQSQ